MKFFKIILLAFLISLAKNIQSQAVTQVVKGKVIDRVTLSPLAGASVILKGAEVLTTTTQSDGSFSVTVPVGRYRATVSFTGYQSSQDELLVVAGHAAFLNITLAQSDTVLEPVEIASENIIELPGMQSVSIEKTLRYPANFFDPVRMITSFPGVVAANDQNNSIVIRGNSPNGLLWRLNGVDIVNPNHLANAGTLSDRPAANGGGVNILSAQMLDRTNFYTGSIPSNYGNTLSGVIDMDLREGNKTEHQFTAQASLIGLDLSAEGPFGKSGKNSFLTNYRYSTVGLLSGVGVNFGDEAITFQDFSFHTDFAQNNGGNFSVFGFWGKSKNEFEAKAPQEAEEDKDHYNIVYDAQTFALGAGYKLPIAGGNLSLNTAYSGSDQTRDAVFYSGILPQTQRTLLLDAYSAKNNLLSSSLRFEKNLSRTLRLDAGAFVNYLANDVEVKRQLGCFICGAVDEEILDGNSGAVLLQPYAELRSQLTSSFELNTGLRYVYFTLNDAASIEPRAVLNIKISGQSSFHAGYSLTSQLQQPEVYFTEGNSDLGFTKSHHIDLAFRQSFTNDLLLRAGVFYQQLFDVPVDNVNFQTFSTLNLMEGFAPSNLENEGTGNNYGVDVTMEKYFFNKSYFLFGSSFYESKYKGGDGVERNTRFNGNYTVTGTYGKEWVKLSKNRTIGLSTRLLYLGGLRESSINVQDTQDSGETVYDVADPFNQKMPDYFRLDLRLSFRKNKPGYTRTFALDIQNLTNQQNEAYHYYDFTQQKVVTKFQLGIIPVLVYRIDF